mgnify:FL=1
MRKNKIGLSTLILLTLLGSCGKTTEPSTQPSTNPSATPTPKPNTSGTGKDTTSSNKELHTDDRIKLKMMGNLYPNQQRSIYAIVDEYGNKDVNWTSSDESIVKVSRLENQEQEEALLTSMPDKFGTVIIKATMADDESIYSEMEVTVEEGEAMNEDMFKTVTGAAKFNINEKLYDYDYELNPTEEGDTDLEIIFEENDDSYLFNLEYNLTDAYSVTAYDNIKQKETMNQAYVRNGSSLSKEYIDINNKLAKETLTNDEGNKRSFDANYANFLGVTGGESDYFSYEDFATFDGGKKYHYIGGYYYETLIPLMLLRRSNVALDDLYFSVTNGVIDGVTMVVDPAATNESDPDTKYGFIATGTISEIGTAKIKHVEPFTHEAYHDTIETARNASASSHNYTVKYSLDYGSSVNMYTMKFNEDAIDQVVTINGKTTHTGIKKTDTGYYEYSYNDTTKDLYIEKTHTTPFQSDTVNRYPTFAFQADIFADKNSNGAYVSRGGNGKNGQFVGQCLYLPYMNGQYIDQGNLYITDGYVSKISTKLESFEEEITIEANYSNYDSTTIDIDWTKAKEHDEPTSFQEANSSLYNEMKAWKIDNVVPYLYAKPGWDNTISHTNSLYDAGHNDCYFETKKFENETARDEFIENYKAKLVEDGWALTDKSNYNDSYAAYKLYTKTINGNVYELSVSPYLNWNGVAQNSVKIHVFSSALSIPDTDW